jgi:hypothetical protein
MLSENENVFWKMAAQYVFGLFSRALAAWQALGLASFWKLEDLGDMLLLWQEAQGRHSQTQGPEKPGTGVRRLTK